MHDSLAQSYWPLRSLLFLPAHRLDWAQKTARTSVDGVILDLEDSVSPDKKELARGVIAQSIDLLSAAGIVVTVRVNALDAGCDLDLAAIVRPGLAAVMLPKTDSVADIAQLDQKLKIAEAAAQMPEQTIGIIPLPETARGMWAAHDIASTSQRVTGLITSVSGPVSGDVARAFGFEPSATGEEQLFLQSRTILASRAAGANFPIGAILGTRLDDLEFVERLIRRAKQLGFSGVALIHPSHVELANRIFRPSKDDIAYAKGLIEAMARAESSGAGAVSYQGAMVDYAMLPTAHQTLALAERFAARDQRRES